MLCAICAAEEKRIIKALLEVMILKHGAKRVK